MNPRAGRVVLLLVVVLHLVADTALSPFYPQLFAGLFGVTDPAATGGYAWACRAAAVVALPLWGLAARRWPLHRLVVTGLVLAAGIDAALGFAPTYTWFLGLSAALVATTMSLALAYPAFLALGGAGPRLPQVRLFTAVTYGAMVVSTLAGAAVMALPNVRWGIASFALADLALAYACHRALAAPTEPAPSTEPAVPPAPSTRPAPSTEPAVPPAPSTEPDLRGSRARNGHVSARKPRKFGAGPAGWAGLVAVGGVVMVAEVARSSVRPFFTEYAESGGSATFGAAVLFLVPALVALLVLPAAGYAERLLGRATLPSAFTLAAAGLAIQATGPRTGTLVAGAILLGAALGIGQIALDQRMFRVAGTRGPAFTAIETLRAVALMISPLAATAAVGTAAGLAGPLLLGALLFGVLGLALALERPARQAPAKEETRVLAIR